MKIFKFAESLLGAEIDDQVELDEPEDGTEPEFFTVVEVFPEWGLAFRNPSGGRVEYSWEELGEDA